MAESKIIINLDLLKNEESITAAEKAAAGQGKYREIVKKPTGSSSWLERWQAVYDYSKPGVSSEGVVAISGKVFLGSVFRVAPDAFSRFSFQFISGLFGKENLLSFMVGGNQSGTTCHFLAFPLKGRQLTPEPWIDSRSKNIKTSLSNKFLDLLSQEFGIDFTDRDNVDNGHTEYLDNFPIVKTSKEDITEVFYNTITEENQVQTDTPIDKVRRITNEVIKNFTVGIEKGTYIKLVSQDISTEEYLREVKAYLKRMYSELSPNDLRLILKKVEGAATGFYILDDLINDIKISDIKVVSPNKIRVKVEGERKTSNLHFIDTPDYFRFLDGLVKRYGLNSDEQIHVFTDTETNADFILRCNLTLGEINSDYPVFHIRKIPKNKYTLEQLIEFGMMDPVVANYLTWAARSASGIVFTGKGSAGKTTLMNTLLEYVPRNSSGLVIQESNELYSSQPEFTFEQISGKYDLKTLAKNGLLTDIDYFIIGEVKGEEAMYFINACDTGNKAWCSVHSPSSTEAINKLADYVMYASKYSHQEALYMLKELQVVVFMKNFKVAEISEVIGWDEDSKNLKYRTVFRRPDLVEDDSLMAS